MIRYSIITVCYNAGKTLEHTIRSVISQPSHNFEYVIIDGGSTDETHDIIAKYRDRINVLVSEKDKGIYDAMNKGVRNANGEYFTFLNADDWYDDSYLAGIDKVVSQNPGIDFIYGGVRAVQSSGKTKDVYFNSYDTTYVKGMPFPHPGLMAKKEVFGKIGEFDVKLKYAADLDWILRMVFAGYKGQSTGKINVNYLIGGAGNSTRSMKESCKVLSAYNKGPLFKYRYLITTYIMLIAGKIKQKLNKQD